MLNQDIDIFIQNLDYNFIEVVNRLIELIDKTEFGFDIAMKWGKITFAKNGDFHHWICAIGVTKNCVTLYFHFGGLLEDPQRRLKSGTSKFLRKLEFRQLSDIHDDVIIRFIEQAFKKLDYFKTNWKEIQKGK